MMVSRGSRASTHSHAQEPRPSPRRSDSARSPDSARFSDTSALRRDIFSPSSTSSPRNLGARASPESARAASSSAAGRPYNQDEAASLISRHLGVAIGQSTTHAIPKIVHRFWTGGPIPEETFNRLLEDGRKAKNNGWKSRLWHSSVVEKELGLDLAQKLVLEGQRKSLKRAGYKIRDIHWQVPIVNKAKVKSLAREAANDVKRKIGADPEPFLKVKFFSDLARLLYLKKMGGIHVDVDMSLGEMDLTKTYYHNDPHGNIPLLGTMYRTIKDGDDAKSLAQFQNNRRLNDHQLVGTFADQAVNTAGGLNALIASRPNTRHLNLAFDNYFKVTGGELTTGMAVNNYLLYADRPFSAQEFDRAAKLSVPPYLLSINQLTEANANVV